jgi:hypothetical protein
MLQMYLFFPDDRYRVLFRHLQRMQIDECPFVPDPVQSTQ